MFINTCLYRIFMDKEQQHFQEVMGWNTKHILSLTHEQMEFQLEMNERIMVLAKDNNMTREEYLFAIHGGGFPCECHKPFTNDFYCTKCGEYYLPLKAHKKD